jgi:serine/threonine-protein kinase
VTAAAACPECGSPVFVEDRFCGTCGTAIANTVSASHAAKLLAELRALTAGEYEIRGEIGRGGMAVVYFGYDLRLNRKVAIKAMLPDLAFHAGMEERFKREARTAARLDHPNIVVIYSVRDSGDPLFFVMKYVDGAPLDAVIRRHGALPIPVVQGILLQICAALQYAHGEGVVHRDVKPANILIDSRGHVQVTDFGIAKAVDSVQLTRTGMAIGTPTYMCPEQCAGRQQSAASDQYSVGVVAYELLTGRPPFGGSAVEMQWAHLRDEPRPLAELRPDCPPTLAAAVMRMLAKEPGERWPALRDAMPLIASGIPVDADASRLALAELVRTSPPTRPSLAVTPLSPLPRNVPPLAAADAPPTPKPAMRAPNADQQAPSQPPVTPPALASLEVMPRQCSVEVGTTERIRCRVRDSQGREVSDTPEWSSSDPAIATVDDTGLVTAHAVGTVTIAAMIGTLASMSNVEVIPVIVARVDVEPNVISVQEHGAVRLTIRAYTA